jgi:hypothetical protein
MAAWKIVTFHSFAQAQYWDGVGALIVTGLVLLVASFVFGGIGALVGEIIFTSAGPRGRQITKRVLLCLGAALLVAIGLTGPRAVPPAEVALWAATGGPPSSSTHRTTARSLLTWT